MKHLFSQPAFRRISLLLFVLIISLVAYGQISYPDAPIRPCTEGYCGKEGALHGEKDYRLYLLWDRALVVTWLTAGAYWVAAWLLKRVR